MKFSLKQLLSLSLLLLLFISCDDSFDSLVNERLEENPEPTAPAANSGNADFSNYVAIGNSLTAGFMDGALYNNGQRFSLGALLAQQFELAGGGEFTQPVINSVNGFNTSVNTGEGPVLGRFKLDTSIPGPSPTLNGDPISPYSGSAADLNNFGVPGLTVGQLLTADTGNPGSPAFNPFYARFASSPGSSTPIGDILSANPTFFSLWMGSNDVLGYALSGATNPAILTSPGDFQQRFGAVINTLISSTSANGVVANIPPILAIPIFRAVSYNVVELDSGTASALNFAFSGFNTALDALVANLGHDPEDAARRKISYQAGNNPILMTDPNLEDLSPKFDALLGAGAITAEQRAALQPYVQARPMAVVPGIGPELVIFSAAQVLGTLADPNNPQSQLGIVIPLPAQFTLGAEDIIEIETARGTFNAIIDGVVQQANAGGTRLGLYDTNASDSAFLDIFGISDGELGIRIGSTLLAPDFSPNGVFSTDGVHPNQRGNAILANDFIRVIENTFNASIPGVDVLNLPSVALCAGDCVSQQGGT